MNSEEQIRTFLRKYGQEHLLKFWNELNDEEKNILLKNINDIHIEESVNLFKRLQEEHIDQEKLNSVLKAVPPEFHASVSQTTMEDLKQLENEGLKEIADGHVGVILLAGGQGTRLGVTFPKGMYNVGLLSKKSLFQIQAERIKKLQSLAEEKYSKSCSIPWYILTSTATSKKTLEFFDENKYFGLGKENVIMFEQSMIPCFDFNGKILMESKYEIAKSPDGNGGLYKALRNNKILQHMNQRGVKYLHVYCVDNILVRVADPIFVGFCVRKGVHCAAKVVEKVVPEEPIGVVCFVENKLQVVEYSEISKRNAALKNTSDPSKLALNAGNICNHFFTLEFLNDIANHHEEKMKVHKAEKKIPYINDDGILVKPDKPNGIKIEKFVFDVFPFALTSIALWEVLRDEEFSALKNSLEGNKDNANTCREAISKLHKKFITQAGGKIIGDGLCEIAPCVSYAGEGLSVLANKEILTPLHLELLTHIDNGLPNGDH